MKEETITKKTVKRFTFRLKKSKIGLIEICGSHFESPDSDGGAISRLLESLDNKHDLIIYVDTEEEEV